MLILLTVERSHAAVVRTSVLYLLLHVVEYIYDDMVGHSLVRQYVYIHQSSRTDLQYV
jgi:hypothetical protein